MRKRNYLLENDWRTPNIKGGNGDLFMIFISFPLEPRLDHLPCSPNASHNKKNLVIFMGIKDTTREGKLIPLQAR